MKTCSESYKSSLVCAGIFALASWFLFFITGPTPDVAAVRRLEKLKALEKQDSHRLESYGWIDRAKGWVRIPIERAMELEKQRLRTVSPHSVTSVPFAPVSLVETPP